MMKPVYLYLTMLIVSLLLVVFVNLDIVYAEGPHQQRPAHAMRQQLNDKQKTEIDSLVARMKAAGASREEIHLAVRDKLDAFGVKPPQSKGRKGGRESRGPWFEDQLNKEQRKVIRAKIDSLWDEGASREEIHGAVSEMLKEYGVEPPEGRFDRPPRHGGHGMRFPGPDLNEEQRDAIRDKVDTMRDEGASREEIHEAVSEMFKEYGVEPPQDVQQHWALMRELNKEQRKEVRETVRQMHEDGASRKEIRKAVDELLEKYGVEKPQPDK